MGGPPLVAAPRGRDGMTPASSHDDTAHHAAKTRDKAEREKMVQEVMMPWFLLVGKGQIANSNNLLDVVKQFVSEVIMGAERPG